MKNNLYKAPTLLLVRGALVSLRTSSAVNAQQSAQEVATQIGWPSDSAAAATRKTIVKTRHYGKHQIAEATHDACEDQFVAVWNNIAHDAAKQGYAGGFKIAQIKHARGDF